MLDNKKKFIIITLMIISLYTIYKLPRLFIKKGYELFPEVKLKEIKNSKTFSIMILNEMGDGYVEYKENNWPSEEYEFKEAKCTDNNGILVENAITFEKETVILETDKTVSCTLYFDKFVPLNLKKLCEDYDNMQQCLEQEKENVGKIKALSQELVGGMHRYQGVGNEDYAEGANVPFVDNNYICFGTNNKDECTSENGTDKYMYQIIGIDDEGKMKLIKAKSVNEDDNNLFIFNYISDPETSDPIDLEWPSTSIFKRLNGISNGEQTGAEGNTNIFINSNRYDYLISNNPWYETIENHKWLFGNIYSIDNTEIIDDEITYGLENNGLILYEIETGLKPTQTFKYFELSEMIKFLWSEDNSIVAKIGLPYLHDINLSLDSTSSIYFNQFGGWISSTDYKDFDFEKSGIYEAFTMVCSDCIDRDIVFSNDYDVVTTMLNYNYSSELLLIYPTFYLNSDIKIISGIGTTNDPYILKI